MINQVMYVCIYTYIYGSFMWKMEVEEMEQHINGDIFFEKY